MGEGGTREGRKCVNDFGLISESALPASYSLLPAPLVLRLFFSIASFAILFPSQLDLIDAIVCDTPCLPT